MNDHHSFDFVLFEHVSKRRKEHKSSSAGRLELARSKCTKMVAAMDLDELKKYRDELQQQLNPLRKAAWEIRWDLTRLCTKAEVISKSEWDEQFAIVNTALDEALDGRDEIKIILPIVFREIRSRGGNQPSHENNTEK